MLKTDGFRSVIDSIRYAATRPRLSDTADWRLAAERTQPYDLPGFDDGIALLDLLTALPDERREAFTLTQLLGLPYAEAALVSGCPVGTVRSRIHRGRRTLMTRLAESESEPESESLARSRARSASRSAPGRPR